MIVTLKDVTGQIDAGEFKAYVELLFDDETWLIKVVKFIVGLVLLGVDHFIESGNGNTKEENQ